jgi:uncharacterized protein (DUF3084 family)
MNNTHEDTIETELPADLTEEELSFDEPAEALFAPLELQQMLQNAYNWHARARFDLFNATRAAEFRKRELHWKQNKLRLGEAFGLLKNAEQRETYLFDQCAEQLNRCAAAEDDQSLAHVEYENASAEVEQARALLRVAELAAYSQRQVDERAEALVGLLGARAA